MSGESFELSPYPLDKIPVYIAPNLA
jgi:hypothetical protein